MKKVHALGLLAFAAGIIAAIVFESNAPAIPLVLWGIIAVLQEDFLEATEISAWMTSVLLTVWAGWWFYDGPEFMGPNWSSLKWALGGIVASAIVGGICTYIRKRHEKPPRRLLHTLP